MSNCPEMESFTDGGLPSKSQSLEIWCCENLIVGLMHCDLRSLPCLVASTIVGNYAMESFPEETLLPSSLTSPKIRKLEALRSLDCKGLRTPPNARASIACQKRGCPPPLSSPGISGRPVLKKECICPRFLTSLVYGLMATYLLLKIIVFTTSADVLKLLFV